MYTDHIFLTFSVLADKTLQAPVHMSACADLVLDASASLGTGGRAMNYTWDIVSGPANWRAVRQYLRILNTGNRLR